MSETHAYIGYRRGKAVMIVVDDGSADMHRMLARHLDGPDATSVHMPIEAARHEIMAALTAKQR